MQNTADLKLSTKLRILIIYSVYVQT